MPLAPSASGLKVVHQLRKSLSAGVAGAKEATSSSASRCRLSHTTRCRVCRWGRLVAPLSSTQRRLRAPSSTGQPRKLGRIRSPLYTAGQPGVPQRHLPFTCWAAACKKSASLAHAGRAGSTGAAAGKATENFTPGPAVKGASNACVTHVKRRRRNLQRGEGLVVVEVTCPKVFTRSVTSQERSLLM